MIFERRGAVGRPQTAGPSITKRAPALVSETSAGRRPHAPMTLETERLRLRPLNVSDLDPLHAMMGEPEVMEYWDIPAIDDLGLTAVILEAQLRDMEAGRALFWSVALKPGCEFVGCCDLSDIDRWHRRADVGFMFSSRYWGAGYAFEAMQAVIRHGVEALGLERLTARVHRGNDRSVGLLTRLGFAPEGVLRGYIARAGERRDCQLFGLLASEPTPPPR